MNKAIKPTSTTNNDRLVREAERKQITSISRSQAWLLEKEGRFPKRIRLGARSVCWRYSELMEWIEQRTGGCADG